MAKGFRETYGRDPIAGEDFDPDKGLCQDDYEYFSSTGRYAAPAAILDPAALHVGDRVRRKAGDQTAGEIVRIIPEVKYPYYAAHPAKAVVRFPDRRRLGGNGYRHSTIAIARLARAEA